MRHDVPADRFQRVGAREHGVSIRVRNHLVRHHDGNAELVGKAGEMAEKFAEVHLPRAELAAAFVLGAEEVRHGVDDDDAEPRLRHHARGGDEELGLMLCVVRLGVRDVVEHGVGVHAETLGDGDEPLGAEGTLGVDVHGLALRAALREGKLARHRERVAQLRLSRPELAVNLSQRARLETPPEKLVEL